ncbi:hypothetical protein [Paenibacillus jilunlii]|uniref:Uncharacterized protein n=1 Tax=Paenibacillus jilunlii TaxID=682956 RepID=A0A1G9RG49_9BACL|nr:hypothetical protein [Paenibacillus jilunlii]SDM22204.1 hypothetical protein SAMN05216191_110101 [Paenibacillus jilunlii]
MSEELSRVKSRKKPNKAEQPSAAKRKNRSRVPSASLTATEAPPAGTGTLSRKSRYSTAPSRKAAQRDERPVDGETTTPSRTESYPSERLRFSKMFINSLIIIFMLLLGFLLWWGLNGAPDLNTLW